MEPEHDLATRPIFHRTQERIEAHIFVAFIAYCLHVTFEEPCPTVRAGAHATLHLAEVRHLARMSRVQS